MTIKKIAVALVVVFFAAEIPPSIAQDYSTLAHGYKLLSDITGLRDSLEVGSRITFSVRYNDEVSVSLSPKTKAAMQALCTCIEDQVKEEMEKAKKPLLTNNKKSQPALYPGWSTMQPTFYSIYK